MTQKNYVIGQLESIEVQYKKKQQPMKPMRHPNKTPQGKDIEKSTECKYYKNSKPHDNCYSKMNHTL